MLYPTIFIDSIKRIGFIDNALRYNPLYYSKVIKIIQQFNAADLLLRTTLSNAYFNKLLCLARKTEYAKKINVKYNWPILDKQFLRDSPSSFFVTGVFGIAGSTGGTTGTPTRLKRALSSIAAEQAYLDWILRPFDLDMRSAKIAVLRADFVKDLNDNKPPYGIFSHGKKRLILSNAHLSKNTVSWFYSALADFGADIFWVYPSMLANFILLLEETKHRLRIPIILTSSESLFGEDRRLFEDAFSSQVVDYYGQGERVCFAVSNQEGEYFFLPSYGKVELKPIDEQRRDVFQAKIIASGFWNTAMPLIRFDTGDIAILPANTTKEHLERVSLGELPFTGIGGRTGEYIVASNGRRISGLNHLPRNVNHLLRMQVVQQELSHIMIKIQTTADFSKSDQRQLIENISELIPPDVSYDIQKAEELAKTPSGKTPFVIRLIDL
jgi:phenylacetate-CoA ligase